MKEKIKCVDGLRGLACFMVLLSHLSLIYFPYLHGGKPGDIKSSIEPAITSLPLGFFYSGTAAVYIFFCLSGYILSYCCFRGPNVLATSTKLLKARYLRLAIPVTVSTLIFYIVLLFSADNHMPWISYLRPKAGISIFDALYNGAVSSFALGDGTYNPVLWTMQVELLGSLALFSFAPFIAQFIHKTLICLLFAFIITLFFPGKLGYGFAAFAFGSAIYYSKLRLNYFIALILLACGVYLAGFHYFQGFYKPLFTSSIQQFPGGEVFYYYFCNLCAGVLIVYVSIRSNILNKLTESTICQWLGKLSFAAYLLQISVFYTLSESIFSFLKGYTKSYVIPASLSMALLLFILYFLSYYFYKYIDLKSSLISKPKKGADLHGDVNNSL